MVYFRICFSDDNCFSTSWVQGSSSTGDQRAQHKQSVPAPEGIPKEAEHAWRRISVGREDFFDPERSGEKLHDRFVNMASSFACKSFYSHIGKTEINPAQLMLALSDMRM